MHANTYQALRCEQLSEDLSGLRFVELPVTPPGPGQVAVSMRAAALNFPDLLMTRGGYQHKPELTYTVGMEGAGVIEAVGVGVTGWREGDAVCFSNLVGSIAQRNLLPATALEPVPAGWVAGRRYAFPNGDSSAGSNYLNSAIAAKGVAPKGVLMRGTGHVPVMQTPAGVNGLWDMGGNVWEWVDSGAGQERVTRGASWWYGPERQREEDLATKPRDTRVVYIGFRCVQTPAN